MLPSLPYQHSRHRRKQATLKQPRGTCTDQCCSYPSWTHEGTPAKRSHTVKAIIRIQTLRFQTDYPAVWKHLPGLQILSQPLICVSQCGCLSMGLRRLHSGFIRSRRWACDAHVVRGSHAGAAPGPPGMLGAGTHVGQLRAEPRAPGRRSHGGSPRNSSPVNRVQPPLAAESSGLRRFPTRRELCSVLKETCAPQENRPLRQTVLGPGTGDEASVPVSSPIQ